MRFTGWIGAFLLTIGTFTALGCQPATFSRSATEERMFGPSAMRIHPTFTQVKNWTGGDKPDGVEVVLELQDQFGEPTRAAGTLRFELWAYHPTDPERRGARLADPWIFPLQTKEEQTARWNPVERGYTFQLPFDKISGNRRYVLTAQFDRVDGRLFDQLNIEPADKSLVKADRRAEHAPSNSPGHSR